MSGGLSELPTALREQSNRYKRSAKSKQARGLPTLR